MSVLRIVSILSIFALSNSAAPAADVVTNTDQPLTQRVRSGPVQLTAKLDRSIAQIAEPLNLTLTAEAPAGVTVTFPPQTETLGTFNVLKVSDAFDIPKANCRQWIRRYQLDSLVARTQTIPPITLAFNDHRGSAPVGDVLQSPSLEITITSVLEDQADPLKFRDVKDVVELPVETKPSHAWIAWSLGGAALLACAGVALLVWPQRKRQLSARRWALAALDTLEKSELIGTAQTQLFYVRLTDIVRRYIERQFAIAATKLTTAEFLDQATRNETLDLSQQDLLRGFLALADLVKFARFEPGAEDASEAIARARQFIEQTAGTHQYPHSTNRQLATTDRNVRCTGEEI